MVVGSWSRIRELHGPAGWWCFAMASMAMLALVPLLSQLPASSPFHLGEHWFPLLGKFACYAIVALSMDLVWGYTGILSLGHAAFFALGGYAMGMHLMRNMAGEGVYRSALPDFMVFLDWKELPWYWLGFDSFGFALAMALFVPGLLAFSFGYFAFRSRIRGVYFSIITQALTYALMLLMFRNETGFGGNNGLTDFKRILGQPLTASGTKLALYLVSITALLVVYATCRYIVTGKLGRALIAVRDAEPKMRFTGYDTLRYKLFAWTFSAVLCGLAGALYVPQVGIVNPGELHPANSIEIAIWVAVGGRGTLAGPVMGALLVNGGKSWLTAAYPDLWLFVLGGLFVGTTLFFPNGVRDLVQLTARLPTWRKKVGFHDPQTEAMRDAL